MRLSITLPAYDEVESLPAAVSDARAALARVVAPGEGEVLIVDDGSRDGTGEVAEQLSVELPTVRVVHHATNEGLGGVYRTGFRMAAGDYLTFFPADGQFPASIIAKFLPLMEEADVVLGYLSGLRRPGVAGLLSLAERALYHMLFGPLPKFQGILMFRRSILDRVGLKSRGRGWAVVLELILRASRLGCPLVSVPTDIRPRVAGASKVRNVSTIWSNLRQAMALRRLL